MSKGLFITFEGPDGSGKSTQIQRLYSYFKDQGKDVILSREPGGTPIGEKIRKIILDKENHEMDSMTEMLLYAASRAQHVAQVIKPALECGKTVICDRFVDSSIAYQGYGRGLGDCVENVNRYAVMDCMPDLTFLMKLRPELSSARIREKEQDRIELEKEQFHREVFCGYEALENAHPERIIGIDGNRGIDEISREILYHVESALNEFYKHTGK